MLYDWSGSKIIRSTSIPAKRYVIGSQDVSIPTDIREWITPSYSKVIKKVIASIDLPKNRNRGSFDKRAEQILHYVINNVTYSADEKSQRKVDFWQFPAETIALKRGDCEDYSFLIASLLLASGISPFCVRVVMGVLTQIDKSKNYHAWTIYKDERGFWRVLEGTSDKHITELPLADELAKPNSIPNYEPHICFNQFHVWEVGPRRIEDVYQYISTRKSSV